MRAQPPGTPYCPFSHSNWWSPPTTCGNSHGLQALGLGKQPLGHLPQGDSDPSQVDSHLHLGQLISLAPEFGEGAPKLATIDLLRSTDHTELPCSGAAATSIHPPSVPPTPPHSSGLQHSLIMVVLNPPGQFCSISINNVESFYLLTGCKSIRENNVKSGGAE